MQIKKSSIVWIVGKAFLCSSYKLNFNDSSAVVSKIGQSDFSNAFRSLASNSVCSGEMKMLESNRELTRSLENVMVNLETAFNTVYYGGFCKFTQTDVDQIPELQCVMDYSQFSSEYISLCHDNGGDTHQVSFLASCENNNLDLQMALINIPSCLGKSCSSLEVNAAILEDIEAAEASLNDRLMEMFKNAKCKFFHDYDLEMQPNMYILSVRNDGKRISTSLPAYIWVLSIVGVFLFIILSMVINKKLKTSKQTCIHNRDDSILLKDYDSQEDCFYDNYIHKCMQDAKKEVSSLIAAVRIYHEKYNAKYEDVPFDEAIEIEYG